MTAKVGAVARVAIDTASAEKNVETPIEFKLFDADGIDVTPSVSVDTTCFVTVTGSYSAIDTSKASKSTITMSNVKDEAEVTVTYNSNENGAQDITATQKVTCVDAKVIDGTKVFATEKVGCDLAKNGCAKFYLGLSDASVDTTVDTYTTTYFCAKDGNKVLSYDSYEVESSNDDVATADAITDAGKFAKINVYGHKEGSAQVNVKATKNGQAKYYTIPVSVKKVSELTQMNVSVTNPTMSNVNDDDYKGTVKVQLLDQYKNVMTTGNVSLKIKTAVTTGSGLTFKNDSDTTTAKFNYPNYEADYFAQDAQAKTYTIEVTGADPRTGKTIVRNINVTVKNIDLTTVSDFSKLTYQIELSTATIDENPIDEAGITKTWDDATTAKLYATYNGLFAGYVRESAVGNVTVADQPAPQLKDVKVSATFGTTTYGSGNLFGRTPSPVASITAKAGDTFKAVAGSDVEWRSDDTPNDTLAKVGNYTIKYVITKTDNKTFVKTKTLSVKNSVVVPKVTVSSRTVDSLEDPDIKKVLATNVDMNNNDDDDSALTSIERVVSAANNKVTVSAALVEDKYAGVTWTFYVPINTTFKTE